ncbi:MAG: GHMP kinase [Alphaproteobacteria bacterium]|nr:GHMP kinase [Alphaproteobacteria bacterium]
MIGTRTPFRFSFVGGGTDLPSFYRERPGKVVSTSIDKYMYIFLHPHFENKFLVKYSRTEFVDRASDIAHPIVRQALTRFSFDGLDINSIADIPAGTGLGSSSAFTVGLLHALYAQAGRTVSKARLASEASTIEIDELKEPIGKQDQFASAFGGFNRITFNTDESVHVEPLPLTASRARDFRANVLVLYMGGARDARGVLADQEKNVSASLDKKQFLSDMADMVDPFADALVAGNLAECGRILEQGWQMKRKLSSMIANDACDTYHDTALANGAIGGKLLGAGGGGFLLFIAPPDTHARIRTALPNLRAMDFAFDTTGSTLIHNDAV